MAHIEQSGVRNALLRTLAPEDFGLLSPALERQPVDHGFSLIAADQPIDVIYFPESGMASMTTSAKVKQVEVGVIGREGFVGIACLLGARRCPNVSVVQMPGQFLTIDADRFSRAIGTSATLKELLLLYVQTVLLQATHTAMANAGSSLESRLARWLLMCHDRSDGDELHLTHEFLAIMLGVRRPGVTVATHVLEGEGMIRARRGRITVRDRGKLEARAGHTYGVPEAEYERLLGRRESSNGVREPDGIAAHA